VDRLKGRELVHSSISSEHQPYTATRRKGRRGQGKAIRKEKQVHSQTAAATKGAFSSANFGKASRERAHGSQKKENVGKMRIPKIRPTQKGKEESSSFRQPAKKRRSWQ